MEVKNGHVKNEQLIQQEPIKGTPFTAVKVNDVWFLAMGKYRIGEHKKTLRAVILDSKDASWERLMTIMNIMIQEDKQLTKTQNSQLNK